MEQPHPVSDLFIGILDVWEEVQKSNRKMRRAGQRKALPFGLTVATLTVGKFVLRVASKGELWFDGDEVVLRQVDDLANRIADSYMRGMVTMDDDQRPLEVSCPKVWPPRRTYRWAEMEISGDDPIPLPMPVANRARDIALRAEPKMMAVLSRTAADHSDEALALTDRWIMLTALGKLSLAMFSQEPMVAAFAESLGEMVSEQLYKEYVNEDHELRSMVAGYNAKALQAMASLRAKRK